MIFYLYIFNKYISQISNSTMTFTEYCELQRSALLMIVPLFENLIWTILVYKILVVQTHLALQVFEYVLLPLCIIPERAPSQTPTLPPVLEWSIFGITECSDISGSVTLHTLCLFGQLLDNGYNFLGYHGDPIPLLLLTPKVSGSQQR